MDIELASQVFKRWGQGQPVAEQLFYKAASALGLNPDDALLEARFYMCLDHDLKKLASGQVIDDFSVDLYSAAAGCDPRVIVKTASSYSIHPLNLAMEKLEERGWVPDLEMLKIALMAPVMDDGASGDQGASMMDPAAQGGGGAQQGQPDPSQQPMTGPQAGAQVQQDPSQRFKPSPMAPVQTPPSEQGNMPELAQSARHPEAGGQAGAGLGGDPGGGNSMMSQAGPQDPAPPMPPDQKILAVQPNIPAQALDRWAGKFQELENQVGMSIDDPQQIAKFIAQMQKDDAKMVDVAIKNMSVQTAPVRPTIQQQAMQKQQPQQGAPPQGQGQPPQQQQQAAQPPKPQPGQEKVAKKAWLPEMR